MKTLRIWREKANNRAAYEKKRTKEKRDNADREKLRVDEAIKEV